MFSKHRRLILWLLCLASTLLLSWGGFTYHGGGYTAATTVQENTSSPTFPMTELTAGSVQGESPSEPTVQLSVQQEAPRRSLSPYLRAAALIAGMALGLVYLFIRQKDPVTGPEIALFAVLWLPNLLDAGLFSEYLQQLLMRWGVLAALLAAARELVWWCFGGFKLNWSISHRLGLLASGTERKSGYPVVLALCCGVSSAAAVALILWNWTAGPWQMAQCAPFLLTVVLSVLCMLRLGRDLEHLTGQIQSLHEGQEILVSTGTFRQQEAQLGELRARMDEAVRTAVTGERFKVELISNVSHDLRTPLTAILGYGELLEGEVMTAQGRERLQQLNRKAGYMRQLVESLFELTKVSSGVEESRQEQIDLIRLLEQTIGLYDDQLNAAKLQVKRHYCAESLPIVTDGARMHQVFANLLGNAIKYALPGTRIHLEVTEGEQVTVRMTNIASYEMDFAPEEILQRFTRGDKARSTEGSGIGLAIAQTYTESVGGSFRVAIDGDQFSAITQLPIIERKP